MAITVTYNLVQGTGMEETRDGIKAQIAAYIKGIPADLSAWAKPYYALGSCGLPAINSAHPVVPELILRSRRVDGETSDGFRVVLVYEGDPVPLPNIEVGTNLVQISRSTDADGEPILVTSPTGDEQKGFISVLVPQTTWTKTRKEKNNPIAKSYRYGGKVNSGGWFGDPSADKGQWLCGPITGHSDDNGETYMVTYTFTYMADGWDQPIIYIDPATNAPPEGAEEIKPKHYKDIDFDGLQLQLDSLL